MPLSTTAVTAGQQATEDFVLGKNKEALVTFLKAHDPRDIILSDVGKNIFKTLIAFRNAKNQCKIDELCSILTAHNVSPLFFVEMVLNLPQDLKIQGLRIIAAIFQNTQGDIDKYIAMKKEQLHGLKEELYKRLGEEVGKIASIRAGCVGLNMEIQGQSATQKAITQQRLQEKLINNAAAQQGAKYLDMSPSDIIEKRKVSASMLDAAGNLLDGVVGLYKQLYELTIKPGQDKTQDLAVLEQLNAIEKRITEIFNGFDQNILKAFGMHAQSVGSVLKCVSEYQRILGESITEVKQQLAVVEARFSATLLQKNIVGIDAATQDRIFAQVSQKVAEEREQLSLEDQARLAIISAQRKLPLTGPSSPAHFSGVGSGKGKDASGEQQPLVPRNPNAEPPKHDCHCCTLL